MSLVRDAEGQPLFFISHVQDIEARRADEADRLRLTDRATLATQAAQIGIFEWELGSSALAWSPEMYTLFGVEDPGHPLDFAFFSRCVHEDDRAALDASTFQALQDGLLDTEFRIRARDEIRIIKVLAKVHRAGDGAPHRMIGANWDVTETRTLAIKAEAASRAKSQFLAVMSHEIRTPMNGILGMAQAMRGDDLPEFQRERLDVIAECGESLLTILNDILDLSKVEAGKMEIEATPFDLRSLLSGMMATYASTAQDRGLALNLDIEARPGVYLGDPTRLRQILANLISNALKFTASGSVSVRIRPVAETLMFEVTDTGLGMDDEVLGRIFTPFAQEDNSTTRKFGGTGLGLSIVRQLAVLMGGDVTVASQPGHGSYFTVTLTLEWLGEAVETEVEDGPEAAPSAALRILAADDNATNQLVLRTLLLQLGVEVTLVSNGREAFEAWRDGDWDVVLMDVQMPVMDGFDATRLIRATEREQGRRPTPIVALTTNAMPRHHTECLDVRMNAMVAKPIDIRLLASALEAAGRGLYDAVVEDRRLAGRIHPKVALSSFGPPMIGGMASDTTFPAPSPTQTSDPGAVRVMVVDDSAVVRGLIARQLESDPGVCVVARAANGRAALMELERTLVDVIVLDLEMPVMDGMTALPLLIAQSPQVCVIIASTLTTRNARIGMQTLQAGAADYLSKPDGGSLLNAEAFNRDLLAKVKALGGRRAVARPKPAAPPTAAPIRPRRQTRPEVLVIGGSTGAPPALMQVFQALKDGPDQPILVAQHMPPIFTAMLAEQLERAGGRPCAEAVDGEPVRSGRAYVAPGGRHMTVAREAGSVVIRLTDDPPEHFCRPAVDPLLRSVAEVYGPAAVAVILTGMGSDGALGCQALAQAGGRFAAQDEATSAVWGMPGAASRTGLCEAVLPVGQIGPWLRRVAA